MKISTFIILTSVLALVLGNSNSEQPGGLIIRENYLPMTSQNLKNQPKNPNEEIAKLERKLAALSLLLNETLKNQKNNEHNRGKNKVSEFQKIPYQPPSDLKNKTGIKNVEHKWGKNQVSEFQKFSYQPPRDWEKTFDDMVTNPFTKSVAGVMVSYLTNLHMIQNFLYNYGIYIIIAPLQFYPAAVLIGTYGYMAFLLLIFIILKTFFFAIIKLILT